MLKNYFKIAIRNLIRHKGFSFINIAGLAMGMACAILIFLWIQNEKSYDTFHAHADHIHRVMSYGTTYFKEGIDGTPAPLAPAITDSLPDVEYATRLADIPRLVFKHGEKIFYEDRGLAVDPSFFAMFSFPFLAGNPDIAFSQPLDMVITEDMAKKYFNSKDTMGKVIEIEGRLMRITGILKNIPANSHIKFDFLVSIEDQKQLANWGTHWGAFNFVTYVQLKPSADSALCGRKMTEIAARNKCPQVKDGVEFRLQPLRNIHMDGRGAYRKYIDLIDGKYVTIFSIIALFILLIACFNFMNLSTARAASRAREVGMRKTIGAVRSQIIRQFLGESFVLSALALVVAILLVEIFLPTLNRIASRDLSLNYLHAGQLLGIAAIVLCTGLVAGLYPALYLSSHRPKDALEGRRTNPGRHNVFRKILVVKQFAVTIVLIIATVVLYKQMHFIQQKDLGFDKEDIVCLPLKENIGEKYSAVKADLLREPNIKDVTAVHYFFPSMIPRTTAYDWEGKAPGTQVDMLINAVGYNFFKTLGINITRGRAFSPRFPTDADRAYIVNEEAVAVMGIESPIGKRFSYNKQKGTIVGVVKNTHFQSLHQKIEPHVFILGTDHSKATQYGAMLIKIQNNNTDKALAAIKNVWGAVNPDSPFEAHFLDQAYEKMYSNERRARTILNYFTILAVFISCLGLFGLASFTTHRRTKEIGIRKTLGASVSQIVLMLSKDFSKWVMTAFVIAVPVSYYIMDQLLRAYAYRPPLGIWVFALSGLLAMGCALMTVSYQSIKAATSNPVEALRYE